MRVRYSFGEPEAGKMLKFGLGVFRIADCFLSPELRCECFLVVTDCCLVLCDLYSFKSRGPAVDLRTYFALGRVVCWSSTPFPMGIYDLSHGCVWGRKYKSGVKIGIGG